MSKNQKIIIGGVIGAIALIGLVFLSNSNKTIDNDTTPSIPPATEESPTFINTVWRINSIADSDPISETSISVQFDEQGRVTGFDGCNNFNTTYTVNGSELTINSPVASNLKACSEGIMSQADIFNQLLLASTSFMLGDGVLALNQGKGTGLTFTGQTNPLSKTSWNITGYNNGNEAVVSPIIDTNPTITFGDDGTISGSSGCNTYSGTYSLAGESITITTLAVTQRECIEPEGIIEQESSILEYLENTTIWQLQGNQLTLRTAEDQIAISATKN